MSEKVLATKETLFEKYKIKEEDNKWESIDSWFSVEIYRLMHDGKLPPGDDNSTKWVIEFLDKIHTDPKWCGNTVMVRNDWGNLITTSKRMISTLHEQILIEINK